MYRTLFLRILTKKKIISFFYLFFRIVIANNQPEKVCNFNLLRQVRGKHQKHKKKKTI